MKDSYELMVQPNMFEEAQEFVKGLQNQLLKNYGTEATRHFWSRTYEGNQNNHYQYRGMIGEDEDEILISKLN